MLQAMTSFNSLTGIIFVWTKNSAAALLLVVFRFNSLTGIIFVWTAAPLKPCKSRTPEAICEHLRNCDCFLTVSGNFSAR